MTLKNSHVLVAVALFGVAEAVYWTQSGATVKVKAVDAIPLFFGFLVPAVLLRDPDDLARWRWRLTGAILLTLVVYDLLSALVISKREPLMGWYLLYPLGGTLLAVMLWLHAHLARLLREEVGDGAA